MSGKTRSQDVDLLENLTQRARMVVDAACREAERYQAPCLGTEHLLLGLLMEERSTGIVADTLKDLKPEDIRIAMRKKDKRTRIEKLLRAPISAEALNALEFAIEESRSMNHRHVTSEHLLLGLLREPDGPAAQILSDAGIDTGKFYRERREFLVGSRTAVVDANVVQRSLRK